MSQSGRTAYLFAAQVLAAAVAFGINILAASVMDPSARGDLAFYLQLTYLLTVFMLLGIERPFVAGQHGPFPHMVSQLRLLMRPGLWFVALPLLGAVFFLLRGEVSVAVSLMIVALYLLGNTSVRIVRVAYIASGAGRPFVAGVIATQFALLALGLVLVVLRISDPNVWFAGYAITSGIAMVIVIVMRDRSVQGPIQEHPDLELVRRRGLRLLPAAFGNTAMLRSDRLLLPLLASNAQLGYYVVVATVLEIAAWPVQQWVDSSLRRWSKNEETPRAGATVKVVAGAGLLALAFAAVLGALAYFVIEYMLPADYEPSLELIVPLAAASVVYAMSRVQQGLLIARGFSGRVSAVEIVGLVSSLGLYVLLIPIMGALGAAIASTVGYSVGFIAGMITLALSQPTRKKET